MNAPVPTLDIWPEQVIRGHSIPGSRYTCRDFMEKGMGEHVDAGLATAGPRGGTS
ncbi:MAG: hypothetical protein CM15mP74_14530 [Halieaceae bacterium]|nr:MAG: hypothetical protein CM15mP74_14530 [Halieaceae bacterium]